MERRDRETRRHILEVAAEMLRESPSQKMRITDVAARADVGVPTIYYHFASRAELIAEAQIANYMELLKPLHASMASVEAALEASDARAFWETIGHHIELSWVAGSSSDKWGIVKLFMDIWGDAKSRETFTEALDGQFRRWVDVIDGAKAKGWTSSDFDSQTLIATIWSSSVGQAVTFGSKYLSPDAEKVRELLLTFIKTAEV